MVIIDKKQLTHRAAMVAGMTLTLGGYVGAGLRESASAEDWAPLDDDGDALRLAVHMGFINPGCWPDASVLVARDGLDWNAATRLAIVLKTVKYG